jgi:hypothetical protein
MNSLYKKEFSDFTLDIKSAIKKNPANKSSNLFRLGSGKENEGTTVAANSKVRPASLRMNSPMMLSSKVPLNTGSRFSVASPISLKGLNIPQSPVNISVTKPSNTATDRSEEDSDASEEDVRYSFSIFNFFRAINQILIQNRKNQTQDQIDRYINQKNPDTMKNLMITLKMILGQAHQM